MLNKVFVWLEIAQLCELQTTIYNPFNIQIVSNFIHFEAMDVYFPIQ